MKNFLIAPSILSADFSKLGQEVDEVISAGADIIHFDVMDNHFVPNLTIGPMVCQSLRDHGVTATIDVHLMVEPVDQLIGSFIDAGADWITFHPEASADIDRSLQLIRDGGCKGGLAINPETSLDSVKIFLNKIDIILLMSVNPGFGGQKFISSVIEKAQRLKALIEKRNPKCLIEVDGGVNDKNVKELEAAGVNVVVAGSFVYKHPDGIEKAISALK